MVGGKCRTVTLDGLPVDTGALFVSHAGKRVRALARQVVRRLVSAETGSGLSLLDAETGGHLLALWRSRLAVARSVLCLEGDILRWRAGGRGNAALGQLSVADYCRLPGRQALLCLVQGIFAAYGYAPLEKAATRDLFEYYPLMRRYVLVPRAAGFVVEGGYAALWRDLAEDLDVRLSHPVHAVRQGPPCRLATRDQEMQFDAIIFACPPEALGPLLPQDHPARALLLRTLSTTYHVLVARASGLPCRYSTVPAWTRPEDGPRPMAWYRPHEASDITCFYAFAPPDIRGEDLARALRRAATQFGVVVGDVLAHQPWQYYPRFTLADRRSGALQALASYQGRGGFWFTGEVASFATVEHVVRHAEHVAAQCLQ